MKKAETDREILSNLLDSEQEEGILKAIFVDFLKKSHRLSEREECFNKLSVLHENKRIADIQGFIKDVFLHDASRIKIEEGRDEERIHWYTAKIQEILSNVPESCPLIVDLVYIYLRKFRHLDATFLKEQLLGKKFGFAQEIREGLLKKLGPEVEHDERRAKDKTPVPKQKESWKLHRQAAKLYRPLYKKFQDLKGMKNEQKRGYELEELLNKLFELSDLEPEKPFKIVGGTRIDGSFYWQNCTFLVEAKWKKRMAKIGDLTVLENNTNVSVDTRGLFISLAGFSPDAQKYRPLGKDLRIFGLDGNDLEQILSGEYSLQEALQKKHRAMGEGQFFMSLSSLKKSK